MSILLLLVLAAIIGTAIWAQRTRSAGEPDAGAGAAAPDRRISLLAEAVGYLGTILVLAGASAAVGQRWEDISTGWRLVSLAITTLLFLAVGGLSRSSSEPAFRRLTGVVWALSVAGFAGAAAVVGQYYEAPARTALLAIAVSSTAYAAALWVLHRHAIQQAVLFGGVLLSTAAIVVRAVEEPESWMVAVPLWAIGLAWAAAGWWRRIDPWFVAVPLGLSVALIAPAAMAETSGLRFGLGLATGGAVLAMSVLAAFTPGLAMGAVAVLGYAIGAVTYYFGDTLGVPASLTITGLLVLTLAAAATRSHWLGRTRPPASRPPATPADAPARPADAPARPADHHHRTAYPDWRRPGRHRPDSGGGRSGASRGRCPIGAGSADIACAAGSDALGRCGERRPTPRGCLPSPGHGDGLRTLGPPTLSRSYLALVSRPRVRRQADASTTRSRPGAPRRPPRVARC